MFKNTMKTTVLLASLGGLIVGVAAMLGGGSSGAILIGTVLALVMVGGSYWFSDKLALKSAGAQVIEEHQSPEFYGMIRDLATRADLPMPRSPCLPTSSPTRSRPGASPATRWCAPRRACCAPCRARSWRASWPTSSCT